MAEELGITVTKKESDEADTDNQFGGGDYYDIDGHFASVEDFILALTEHGCNEIEFDYDGHSYCVADYKPPQAWEAYKTIRSFKDVPDMVDNYVVHTGERLREIITKLVVESSSF
ncbi:MAG: hypothetical protein LBT23_01495 [Synergistaceae bacterium]|nr:hypothetical protein [Synergistaceae bacterium]